MKIEQTPNGNLLLSLEDGDAEIIDDAREQRQRYGWGSLDESILWDLMESYWANGSYQSFIPSDGENGRAPFVGLTEAPCICTGMTTYSDGMHVLEPGHVWWFPDYMVESCIDTLRERGQVVFQHGFVVSAHTVKDEGGSRELNSYQAAKLVEQVVIYPKLITEEGMVYGLVGGRTFEDLDAVLDAECN